PCRDSPRTDRENAGVENADGSCRILPGGKLQTRNVEGNTAARRSTQRDSASFSRDWMMSVAVVRMVFRGADSNGLSCPIQPVSFSFPTGLLRTNTARP